MHCRSASLLKFLPSVPHTPCMAAGRFLISGLYSAASGLTAILHRLSWSCRNTLPVTHERPELGMPCHFMSPGFWRPPDACCPNVGSKQHLEVELPPVSQMFIPTLLSQASPDQQAEWLPKALGLKLIGKASASVHYGTQQCVCAAPCQHNCRFTCVSHSPAQGLEQ